MLFWPFDLVAIQNFAWIVDTLLLSHSLDIIRFRNDTTLVEEAVLLTVLSISLLLLQFPNLALLQELSQLIIWRFLPHHPWKQWLVLLFE